uniref:Uncharacterized protein n=1 Tax=Alexandrium catenella TaxID=2925 RepID=A0A7S1WCF9_ALECA|mmetsp:Transcript_48857/g.130781  ORF Transcript_48857/g.130781 Transcript_48857/m.130781 type:complete len:106 (+) Transcript_48857:794-1111(+)
MAATDYYKVLNEQVLQAYTDCANWRLFLVDGTAHVFNLDEWRYYNQDITGSWYSGPLGDVADTGSPIIAEYAVDEGNYPDFVCEGEQVDPAEAGDSVTYCDSNLR